MKKKVIMIGVVLIVCLGTVFYNMQKRDPYKSYNHLKTSEVLKVKEFNQYWVYFYSLENKDSINSDNGIGSLSKSTNSVYFVEMQDKKIKIKKQTIQPTTLLYIKNHKIVKTYQGLKQLKEKHEEILEMSW